MQEPAVPAHTDNDVAGFVVHDLPAALRQCLPGPLSEIDQFRLREEALVDGLFGVDAARERIDELSTIAARALDALPGDTTGLLWLGRKLVNRDH